MRNLLFCLVIAGLIVVFSETGEAIKDDALVLYCPFSKDTGDEVKEESGNGLKGALKGGPKWTKDGRVEGGMAFSAAS